MKRVLNVHWSMKLSYRPYEACIECSMEHDAQKKADEACLECSLEHDAEQKVVGKMPSVLYVRHAPVTIQDTLHTEGCLECSLEHDAQQKAV
ncbi:hypothetical protein DPMN_071913 [Dreissena polymorpha]|uniref:Uncharacterized protein n=1 Tax=Dreissena polymorpha TaxID=45954 RepID=A0A9D3Z3R3_DREPO|nr:hypothetical protein DPMN_071913 [Dreissena polymorpha]